MTNTALAAVLFQHLHPRRRLPTAYWVGGGGGGASGGGGGGGGGAAGCGAGATPSTGGV